MKQLQTNLENLKKEFGVRLVELRDGSFGLRSSLEVKMTTDDSDADTLHMVASNDALDRYDETIVAAGWQLKNYERNPVIQNSHQYGNIIFTIGKALKTWIDGDALKQTWKFATKENPFAKIARDLYAGGFLNASSVGFIPLTWETGNQASNFRRKYLTQELLEVSAVSIPANPEALTLAVKSGAVEKADLRELNALLKTLCNDDAGTRTHSTSQGSGSNGEELLRLAREVKSLTARI